MKSPIFYKTSFQFGFTFLRSKKADSAVKSFLLFAKTTAGFTLVEIIIAITIVTILSTIGIAGFNSANSGQSVLRQAQDIKSIARRLRTDALASRKPVNCTSTTYRYYGTFIKFRQITPADHPNNYNFMSGPLCYNIVTGSESPFGLQATTNFQSGVYIQQIGLVNPNTTLNTFSNAGYIYKSIDILFLISGETRLINNPGQSASSPLKGMLSAPSYIYPTGSGYDVVTNSNRAYVIISDGTRTRQINFNRAGLVCDEPVGTSPSCAD